MAKIPRVVLPKVNANPEIFIQLYVKGKPYLRSGPTRYHSDLIEKTLLGEFDFQFVENETVKGRSRAILKGDEYEVVGMGSINYIDKDSVKVILIEGGSLDYATGLDKEHFKKIKPHFPKGIEIRLIGDLQNAR